MILTALLFLFPAARGECVAAQDTQILTVEEIKERAAVYLIDRLSWDPDAMDVEIIYDGKDLDLPNGVLELNYQMAGKTRRAGRIPLALQIKVDGKFQRRLRLSSMVMVSQDVVKTLRPIKSGDLVEPGDVEIEKIKSKRIFKNAATRLEDVVGFEASRYLQSGKVVPMDSVQKPHLVNKGDRVILTVQKGGMKITAPGISIDDGFKNSLVQVIKLQSKKTVYGRVKSPTIVEVGF